MTAEIRPAEERDIDALTSAWIDLLNEQGELEEQFGPAEDAEERWRNDVRELIRDDECFLQVAIAEGDLAGFVRAHRWVPAPVYAISEEVFIDELYVIPAHRRGGIGRALVGAVEEWAAERGLTGMRLSVLHQNEGGRAFWKSCGAKPFAVEMIKQLPHSDEEREREADAHKRPIGF